MYALVIPAAVKWQRGLLEVQAMKQSVLAQAPVLELLQRRGSERQGRLIDNDQIGSMEKKKQEGYF